MRAPTLVALHIPSASHYQSQGSSIITFTTKASPQHQLTGQAARVRHAQQEQLQAAAVRGQQTTEGAAQAAAAAASASAGGDAGFEQGHDIDIALSFQSPSDALLVWQYIHSFPEVVAAAEREESERDENARKRADDEDATEGAEQAEGDGDTGGAQPLDVAHQDALTFGSAGEEEEACGNILTDEQMIAQQHAAAVVEAQQEREGSSAAGEEDVQYVTSNRVRSLCTRTRSCMQWLFSSGSRVILLYVRCSVSQLASHPDDDLDDLDDLQAVQDTLSPSTAPSGDELMEDYLGGHEVGLANAHALGLSPDGARAHANRQRASIFGTIADEDDDEDTADEQEASAPLMHFSSLSQQQSRRPPHARSQLHSARGSVSGSLTRSSLLNDSDDDEPTEDVRAQTGHFLACTS